MSSYFLYNPRGLHLLWCFFSKTNKPWLIRVRLPSLKDQRTLRRRTSTEKNLTPTHISSTWESFIHIERQRPSEPAKMPTCNTPQVWERQGCLYSTEGSRAAEQLWKRAETAEHRVSPARSPHPFSHRATGQLWVGNSVQAVADDWRGTNKLYILSGLLTPGRTPQSPSSSMQRPSSC